MQNFEEIIKFAIEQEVEAQRFYTSVAAKANKDAVKKIFLEMAAEEERHEIMLKNVLENKETHLNFTTTEDYGISATVEKPEVSDEMSLADIFAIAMKNEEKAMIMYQQLARDCTSPEIQQFFEELAKMEQGHKFTMEQSYTDVAYGEVW